MACDANDSLACGCAIVTVACGAKDPGTSLAVIPDAHWLPLNGEPLRVRSPNTLTVRRRTEKKDHLPTAGTKYYRRST
jgi:hypothetical protein